MSQRETHAFWAGGIVVSMLGNAGLLLVAGLAIAPAPPADPPPPETGIDILAYQVPAQDAEAKQPETEAGRRLRGASDRLADTVVPRGASAPITPRAQTAARSPPRAGPVAARPPDAQSAPALRDTARPAREAAPRARPGRAVSQGTGAAAPERDPATGAAARTPMGRVAETARLSPAPADRIAAMDDAGAAAPARPAIEDAITARARLPAASRAPELSEAGTPARAATPRGAAAPTLPRTAAAATTAPPRPAPVAQVPTQGDVATAAEARPTAPRQRLPQAAPAVARAPVTTRLQPPDPPRTMPAGQAAPAAESARPAGMPAMAAAERGPVSETAQRAPSGATVAPPQTPDAARMSAELAWSAGGAESVDPVSLTAITALMQPGLARDRSERLRDGLDTVLGTVGCARLQAIFQPETGRLALHGHVPDAAAAGPVRAALKARLGESIPIDDRLLVLPRPQCDSLDAVARVGLPQSTEQTTDPRILGREAHVREYSFVEGDRLVLDLEAPDYPAYVYVDYFDAAGRVIHLQPNETIPLRRLAPGAQLQVGAATEGAPALDIRVAPPFGQEIAVAFASSVPLFDAPRPLVEPAMPYLEEMRARVEDARAEDPEFRGEWVYFFITTGSG